MEQIKEALDKVKKEEVAEKVAKQKGEEKLEELRKAEKGGRKAKADGDGEKRKMIEKKENCEKRWEMTKWMYKYTEKNYSI